MSAPNFVSIRISRRAPLKGKKDKSGIKQLEHDFMAGNVGYLIDTPTPNECLYCSLVDETSFTYHRKEKASTRDKKRFETLKHNLHQFNDAIKQDYLSSKQKRYWRDDYNLAIEGLISFSWVNQAVLKSVKQLSVKFLKQEAKNLGVELHYVVHHKDEASSNNIQFLISGYSFKNHSFIKKQKLTKTYLSQLQTRLYKHFQELGYVRGIPKNIKEQEAKETLISRGVKNPTQQMISNMANTKNREVWQLHRDLQHDMNQKTQQINDSLSFLDYLLEGNITPENLNKASQQFQDNKVMKRIITYAKRYLKNLDSIENQEKQLRLIQKNIEKLTNEEKALMNSIQITPLTLKSYVSFKQERYMGLSKQSIHIPDAAVLLNKKKYQNLITHYHQSLKTNQLYQKHTQLDETDITTLDSKTKTITQLEEKNQKLETANTQLSTLNQTLKSKLDKALSTIQELKNQLLKYEPFLDKINLVKHIPTSTLKLLSSTLPQKDNLIKNSKNHKISPKI